MATNWMEGGGGKRMSPWRLCDDVHHFPLSHHELESATADAFQECDRNSPMVRIITNLATSNKLTN